MENNWTEEQLQLFSKADDMYISLTTMEKHLEHQPGSGL